MSKKKIYTKRNFLKILGATSIGVGGFSLLNILNKNLVQSKWSGEVLNGPASIEIHAKDKDRNNYIIKKIDHRVEKFDSIFNLQNKNSEISKLNKEKFLVNPSKDLIDVINKSIKISNLTNGLFDITVQPLWEMYYNHFIIKGLKEPPARELISKTSSLVNYKNIRATKDLIELENRASITLNGIAQGWITDNITAFLREAGIKNTLVDFGETFALGKYKNKRDWNILLNDSNSSELIKLTDMAVATSAGSATSFEPTHSYHHIFNPKTGKSSNQFKTISIVSNRAWISDAISTASISMPKNKLAEVCRELNAEAYTAQSNRFIKIS